jgi:hypothetical protein
MMNDFVTMKRRRDKLYEYGSLKREQIAREGSSRHTGNNKTQHPE